MRILTRTETNRLVVKLVLLILLGSAVVMTAAVPQQRRETQCVPEANTRKIAVNSPLPEYPQETEEGSSAGVVFVAVAFGTDGELRR